MAAATAQLNASMVVTSPVVMEEKQMSMKLRVQSKIEASTIMKDLDALDSFTEDWPNQGNLKLTALAIHLRCEGASNECQGIIDAMEAFGMGDEGELFAEEFVAMVVRHEFATGKVNQIHSLLAGVITGCTSEEEEAELGIDEMKMRVDGIMAVFEDVKKRVEALNKLTGAMVMKWQTQTINGCIQALQGAVAQLVEAVAAPEN